jgi:toxin CcdB
MAQFDIHRNAAAGGGGDFPYLLDIQSDFLDRLNTRLVVPLMALDRFGEPIGRLNPVFEVAGSGASGAYVGVFTEMAGVSRNLLGEVVDSAAARRDEIVAAVDFMVQGL